MAMRRARRTRRSAWGTVGTDKTPIKVESNSDMTPVEVKAVKLAAFLDASGVEYSPWQLDFCARVMVSRDMGVPVALLAWGSKR